MPYPEESNANLAGLDITGESDDWYDYPYIRVLTDDEWETILEL